MEEALPLNICRACNSENSTYQSIFVPDESTGLTLHLAEMIMAYASVQITLGDGLPEQICTNCSKIASTLYLFKLKCEETDKLLRNKLGKSPLVKPYSILEEQEQYNAFDLDNDSEEDVVVKPEIFEATEETVGNEKETCDNYSGDDLEMKSIYECDICDKIFITKATMQCHKLTHNDMFACIICNKCFTSEADLDKHKESHVPMTQLVILPDDQGLIDLHLEDTKCNVLDDSEINFKGDHNKEDSKEVFSCEICKKSFSKNSHLTRHMKLHSLVKPFTCTLCNKGFSKTEQLTHHLNIHSGIKPHVCKICGKGFNQISNLKDHMRTHNGEKPFLCSTCGKGFNQLGNLRQHTVRHSGIKAHLCSICGNGFASKGELGAHLRKHTGARPFVCSVCNHGFTTSSSLTKHKRIHSGEKPYECEVCKMKFSRSGILARHRRTHTGEKPYVCKFCTKAFSQSNDLSSHLRIHTGEKPYICDVCGHAFRQSSALKTHKKTHIDKTSFIDQKPVITDKNYFDSRVVISMVHSTFLNTLQ